MRRRYLVAITCTHLKPPDLEREILKDIADVKVTARDLMTEDALLRFAGEANALLLGAAEPVTRRVIEDMPNLRVLSRYGIGVDNIDVSAATRRGILVTNAPDYALDEVADHAFALILALNRKLPRVDFLARQGKWFNAVMEEVGALSSCSSQTLGLLGFGRIARRVALRAKPFGFKVLSYDPWLPRWEFSFLQVEKTASLDELLARSDILSVHIPLTPSAKGLLGKRELGLMKPSACIVNTSRGAIIDQSALRQALSDGRLAGAALDVFEKEPLDPHDPLVKLDNIILTPHMAWYTEQTTLRLKTQAARGVADALLGLKPEFLVNPEVLKRGD